MQQNETSSLSKPTSPTMQLGSKQPQPAYPQVTSFEARSGAKNNFFHAAALPPRPVN